MRKIRLLIGFFVMFPHIVCLIISKHLGGVKSYGTYIVGKKSKALSLMTYWLLYTF